MSCGALLLDSSGAVLDTNMHAERILQAELSCATEAPSAEWSRNALKRLLARADGRFTIDQEAWITVSRPDSAPLVLHAIPVANGAISGPHTILIFVDLSRRPQPNPGVLQRLFDLTPAEARLAIGIGSGKTLAEIAEETCLSNATLRTQLSSVFMKTQTRRQPELVALLARVAILP
jgi:DNA-binding CsgD family transcriptional regulator